VRKSATAGGCSDDNEGVAEVMRASLKRESDHVARVRACGASALSVEIGVCVSI
jgi:hypothetical protein